VLAGASTLMSMRSFSLGPNGVAGPDTLVCTLEDSLLPAERTMVEMGYRMRGCTVGPRVGWAAAELLFVQFDHGVGHFL
jgi:hypothetical protein